MNAGTEPSHAAHIAPSLSATTPNTYVLSVRPSDDDSEALGREEAVGGPAGDALAAEIRRALGIMPQSAALTNPELLRLVRGFAQSARTAGRPPERMLINLVTILAESLPPSAGEWWRSVLRDRLVVWAIEGYYQIDIER